MKFFLQKSLKTKLMLIFFLLSFLPAVLVGVLSLSYFYLQEKNSAFSALEGINASKTHQIIKYMENTMYNASSLAENRNIQLMRKEIHTLIDTYSYISENFEQKLSGLMKIYRPIMHGLHSASGFSESYIISKANGTFIFTEDNPGEERAIGMQISASDEKLYECWNEVRRTGLPMIQDFRVYENTGHPVMHVCVPLYDESGTFTDVMILALPNEQIELITSFEFGRYNTRESYLLSSENRVITKPLYPEGTKMLGTIYSNKALQIEKDQSTFIDIINDNIAEKRVVLAAKIIRLDEIGEIQANFDWTIITQMDQLELSAPARTRSLVLIFFLIGASVAALIIGYFIVKQIVSPLLHLNDEVTRLSQGHLDISIHSERKDEIGSLINNTNHMITSIAEIVKAIRTAAEKTNETGTSIAVSVEQQSAISVEQAGSIAEISTTMDEFASSFTQVSENTKSVSEVSEKIYTYVNDSSELINSVAEKINDINGDNDRNISNIMNLKQRSRDIAKVMGIINTISDQTKIIAFNAALEASSAGESGKRFGVVAAEIRKLTESVIDSTANIDKIINEIQNLADQMVVASEKTTKNIQKGLESSNESVNTMEFIVGSVKSSHEATQQISLSVQQQQTAAAQIQIGLKEISLGAQQNSEAIQALNETGTDFKAIGKQLSVLLKQFKLSSENQGQLEG
ncbi:MAG: methyl-accepting chemotaxis protein [Spirochaetales bacterium]|nr:methyl-accepting chemotaxis protein [Spirochaetales bacterium]